jgi:uncharacterized protein (DUF58 family)
MREGDDHRDIYWRKSTMGRQMVLRERAHETSRQITLVLESQYPGAAPEPLWLEQFEVRIREVASRCVAHIKRGDFVNVRTTAGENVVGNSSVGADPVLRFLALLEPSSKATAPANDGSPGPARRAPALGVSPLSAVLSASPLPTANGAELNSHPPSSPRGRA